MLLAAWALNWPQGLVVIAIEGYVYMSIIITKVEGRDKKEKPTLVQIVMICLRKETT